MNLYCTLTFFIGVTFCGYAAGNKKVLFDFTDVQDLDNWSELSDTVRTAGKSKAVLTLHKSQLFQRAVFFTLLDPQTNGAGFAGIRTRTNFNLSQFQNLQITCRARGSNSHYKITFRHKGLDSDEDLVYEQSFTVPISDSEFFTIVLPFEMFKAYYHGREVTDAEPLDTAHISMLGIQIFGGVYTPIKQAGVSALEIENIVAS